jgi:murein L,D-transpeptidase YafK
MFLGKSKLLRLGLAALPIVAFLLLLRAGHTETRPPLTERADRVVVFKSQRKMKLMKNGAVLRTYVISLGAVPKGHKQREGDERTPEGVYTLDWRNARSSCYRSLHISYPNETDRMQAAKRNASPGGMVMMHGLHPSISWMGKWHRLYDWTDGCVAVANAEMDEIWQAVPDGTPMEIRP